MISPVAAFAHGVEVAQCVYPAWQLKPVHAIASRCLHAVLLVGPHRR